MEGEKEGQRRERGREGEREREREDEKRGLLLKWSPNSHLVWQSLLSS